MVSSPYADVNTQILLKISLQMTVITVAVMARESNLGKITNRSKKLQFCCVSIMSSVTPGGVTLLEMKALKLSGIGIPSISF